MVKQCSPFVLSGVVDSSFNKEVAEQLIIDIERYQAVPECQILVCFVYDPEGFIENPLALKKDLEKPMREIEVKVIIYKP